MNEEEIERLNRFKTIKVLYGNTFTIHLEQLEQLQNDIETVLNLLEKKDRTIQQLKDENRTLNRQAQQYFEQGIKKDKIIYELEDIFYNYQLCEYELTDCTYRKCEYIADDENPPCKECIKQYFERKVENGN